MFSATISWRRLCSATMTKLRHQIGIASVLLLALVSAALATTWLPKEVTCPVCGAVNTFQIPGSYGSYVYQEPSKYQYVFWPATTDKFLYTCKQCRYTAYMGDFEDDPERQSRRAREDARARSEHRGAARSVLRDPDDREASRRGEGLRRRSEGTTTSGASSGGSKGITSRRRAKPMRRGAARLEALELAEKLLARLRRRRGRRRW